MNGHHGTVLPDARATLAALNFGALALLMPGITLLSLVTLFAACALVGRLVSVYFSVRLDYRKPPARDCIAP